MRLTTDGPAQFATFHKLIVRQCLEYISFVFPPFSPLPKTFISLLKVLLPSTNSFSHWGRLGLPGCCCVVVVQQQQPSMFLGSWWWLIREHFVYFCDVFYCCGGSPRQSVTARGGKKQRAYLQLALGLLVMWFMSHCLQMWPQYEINWLYSQVLHWTD